MTRPFCGRDEEKERPQQRIMAISTARDRHLARRAANMPPGSMRWANRQARPAREENPEAEGLNYKLRKR